VQDDVAIHGILCHVGRLRVLPTLAVVHALGETSEVSLSSVKSYIIHALCEDEMRIQDDINVAKKYKNDTIQMRADVHELLSSPRIFQNNRCALCNSTLDLPAVHFLCMHSFHSQCCGETDKECMRCSTSNNTVKDIRKSLTATSCNHDKFFQALEGSEDGFAVMVEHLGRSALDSMNAD